MNPSISEIKKDLKKLSKKQLIERVMIWINRSSNLATNLNRLERELQKNDSMNDSKHQDMLDLESTVSRLRWLLITYQELAERGYEESIEVMAERLYELSVDRFHKNIKILEDKWKINVVGLYSFNNWAHTDDSIRDTYRVHLTKIITKDCQD